jgi:hypothetical protein
VTARRSKKQRAGPGGPKPQKSRGKPPETDNKQVAEQVRKILRTHYASKYRVR